MGEIRTCSVCGKSFDACSHGPRKYCSKACRNSITGRVNRICPICGNEFITLKNNVENGKGIYCSIKCYNIAQYPHMTTICLQCGKEFPTVSSRIDNGQDKYCSMECHGMARRGENSHLWKGGVSKGKYCELFNNNFKRRVRAYFDNKCVVCGKTSIDNGCNLCVHHVHYDKKSCCGEEIPRQFVVLCRKCHSATNSRREYWEEYFTKLIHDKFNNKCYYTKEEYATYMSLL